MDERDANDGGTREERIELGLLRAAPTLMRLAAGAYVRTAQWSFATSYRMGTRMVRAAASGESPTQVAQDASEELREYLRRFLGYSNGDEGRDPERPSQPQPPSHVDLRRRGAELLAQSADVDYEEPSHPAFDRILNELAPDEARILRLLHTSGPQPAVDVREARPLGIAAQLIAPGLTMIGSVAGVRFVDRVPSYLNNLYRLGLIWFSREPMEDPLRYQVLEAQPDVISAIKSTGRGKTVRRSIHLTPFGQDFCATCLPMDTAEIDALPG